MSQEPPYSQISIKGVLEFDGKIILLKNEREEWELPGGRIEKNETPETCLQREVQEELNLRTEATGLLNVWMYQVTEDRQVFIVTFATEPVSTLRELKVSHEHQEVGFFSSKEIDDLNMPSGYKKSIELYFNQKTS